MQSRTPQITDDLFGTLREREAQARAFGARHLVAVPDRDSMLYWLTRAAKEAREALRRKQVHVAASLSVDQSTVARFEKGLAWPRDADEMIDAYAEDLDIDPLELWEQAVRMWREDRASAAETDRAVAALEEPDATAGRRRGRS